MKRTPLRRKGKSANTTVKDQIQAALRTKVILRDGGCLLRNHPQAGACGGYNNEGDLILQAEHLNGRANSISFAELDNVICLCKFHHIFFKKQNPALYWVLVRERIGLDRWLKVEAWIKDRKPHKLYQSDWEDALAALTK